CAGPSRGGLSLSWIGPRRRADRAFDPVSSRGSRLALLSRGLRCALSPSLLKELPRRFEGAPSHFAWPLPGSRSVTDSTYTLNRAPRARLARLADEPPVRGMGA